MVTPDPIERFAVSVFEGLDPIDQGTSQSASVSSPSSLKPGTVRVLPVLAPNDYMKVVSSVIAASEKSLDIQIPYLVPKGANVQRLLNTIKIARNRGVKVRMIVDRRSRVEDEGMRELSKFGFDLDREVRLLSRRSGRNCNSKLIVIDRRVSLVGSTNWSDNGLVRNGELNTLTDSSGIADYFKKVFEAHWNVGERLPAPRN